MRTRLKALAKDHLQQAYYILHGDEGFADVRRLIARTLDIMERDPEGGLGIADPPVNVLRFWPLKRPASLPPCASLTGRRRVGAADG